MGRRDWFQRALIRRINMIENQESIGPNFRKVHSTLTLKTSFDNGRLQNKSNFCFRPVADIRLYLSGR